MRLLFDANTLGNEYCGISKSLLFLYERCHRLDPDFQALGFGYSGTDYLKYADRGIVLMGRCYLTELDEIARDLGFQAVHFPENFAKPRKIKGIPMVATVHDFIPFELGCFENLRTKVKLTIKMHITLRDADVVLTPSEYSRAAIEGFARGPVRTEVMPWGVTLPDVVPDEGPGYPYYLYVGGYDPRKGIDVLVQAYDLLVREGRTDARLVLAGRPKPLGSETDRLIQEGVERGRIVQTGDVTDEEICSLYAHALCSLYLSLFEGFGLPLIEAMRYGCPVISSTLTCLPEIGGDAACYVDRDDVREVAAAMQRMQDDEAFRQERIRLGYRNLERFDWDRTARRFLDILQGLAQRC